jgi:hypothetical protein
MSFLQLNGGYMHGFTGEGERAMAMRDRVLFCGTPRWGRKAGVFVLGCT